MTYSLIDDKYIYTYEVEETNKKEILDILKKYSPEIVVEFKDNGPAGIIERSLIRDVKNLCDEIVEYEFKYGGGNGKYGGPLNVTIVAIVKKYPDLYRILNSDFDPSTLLLYLNNVESISKAYKKNSHFKLVNAVHQYSKEKNIQCNYNYDSHIDMDTKLSIIKKYISGLNFKLIDKKSLKELKEEKAFLSKMESNEHQIALLKQIDDKIKNAHEDTKNLNDLMQLLNLEKENKLVKTK